MYLILVSERISDNVVSNLSDCQINEQLANIYQIVEELRDWKEKMQNFNLYSNEMLDAFHRDDGHNFSHLSSRLNTKWTKFNEALQIRRAVFFKQLI